MCVFECSQKKATRSFGKMKLRYHIMYINPFRVSAKKDMVFRFTQNCLVTTIIDIQHEEHYSM